MPRPAPRVAPATSATLPARGFCMSDLSAAQELMSMEILVPESRCGVDLLNDVDPRARWIVQRKASLTPRLIAQPVGDRYATPGETVEFRGGVGDLDREEH